MPYPGRPRHEVLPPFVGTNGVRQTAEQRARLLAFVAEEYEAGKSIHELAEMTGRAQSAVRRALATAGVPLCQGPLVSAQGRS